MACSLEPPLKRIDIKQGSSTGLQPTSVFDDSLNWRDNCVSCFVGVLLPFGDVKEDEDRPKPHSFIQVLRWDVVNQD